MAYATECFHKELILFLLLRFSVPAFPRLMFPHPRRRQGILCEPRPVALVVGAVKLLARAITYVVRRADLRVISRLALAGKLRIMTH